MKPVKNVARMDIIIRYSHASPGLRWPHEYVVIEYDYYDDIITQTTYPMSNLFRLLDRVWSQQLTNEYHGIKTTIKLEEIVATGTNGRILEK
jgi:hypothetical protein